MQGTLRERQTDPFQLGSSGRAGERSEQSGEAGEAIFMLLITVQNIRYLIHSPSYGIL